MMPHQNTVNANRFGVIFYGRRENAERNSPPAFFRERVKMYIIKTGSVINAYIFYNDEIVDTYDFVSPNELVFDTTHFCGNYVCDCCEGVTIKLIDVEYSQKIGLAVIYETQIQNIAGFENCTTKEESDELIYQKVCDLHGIAYDRGMVECA